MKHVRKFGSKARAYSKDLPSHLHKINYVNLSLLEFFENFTRRKSVSNYFDYTQILNNGAQKLFLSKKNKIDLKFVYLFQNIIQIQINLN